MNAQAFTYSWRSRRISLLTAKWSRRSFDSARVMIFASLDHDSRSAQDDGLMNFETTKKAPSMTGPFKLNSLRLSIDHQLLRDRTIACLDTDVVAAVREVRCIDLRIVVAFAEHAAEDRALRIAEDVDHRNNNA